MCSQCRLYTVVLLKLLPNFNSFVVLYLGIFHGFFTLFRSNKAEDLRNMFIIKASVVIMEAASCMTRSLLKQVFMSSFSTYEIYVFKHSILKLLINYYNVSYILYLKLPLLAAVKTNFRVFAFYSQGICGQFNIYIYFCLPQLVFWRRFTILTH